MTSNSGNILQKLLDIQTELKAPKGQYNSFAKYHYRSAEDILEAVKPLCLKHNAVLVVTDELRNVGDRYYVKATGTLYDIDSDSHISASANAREEADKKGMDGSQITGAASSYARKYALNGLFCIDDTKDADTDEHAKKQQGAKNAKPPTAGPPTADPPDDPGNYHVEAPGKIYSGYTIRQIHLGKGGPEVLERISNGNSPIGSHDYEIQQAVVRYLEKQASAQDDEDLPF